MPKPFPLAGIVAITGAVVYKKASEPKPVPPVTQQRRTGPAAPATDHTKEEDGMKIAQEGKTGIVPLLLLEWESQQWVSWQVTVTLRDCRFKKITIMRADVGWPVPLTLGNDGKTVSWDVGTSWEGCSAVLELDGPPRGSLAVRISDKHVSDRLVERELDLSELTRGTEEIRITSRKHQIRNALVRVSTNPETVNNALALLARLGSDRRANINTLLQAADEVKGTATGAKLLLRAAATCTGGCNHSPLPPDGWDWAIRIYERVMKEYPDTEFAVNARWAHAACHGCWSQWAGCDAEGIGKGDWSKALDLYKNLYESSEDAGTKAEALLRIAELQCSYARMTKEGIKTYRRYMAEFPGDMLDSPYWTFRTCDPRLGREKIQEMFTLDERDELTYEGSATIARLVSVGGCRIQKQNGHLRLSSIFGRDATRVGTVEEYPPPIRIKARARSSSSDIRLYYGRGMVIFNMGKEENTLVVSGLGEHQRYEVPGKGHLKANEWHDIIWEIMKDDTRIIVDGEQVYSRKGDHRSIRAEAGIGPAWGSKVGVASFLIEPL